MAVPRISDAEWDVMNVVWDGAPITAAVVVERLASDHAWSEPTVKTMLNRLVRKGALAFDVDGKRYRYRAKVSREACIRAEGRSFLRRVFADAPGSMLVHFVRDARLSPAEIAELERLLAEKRS